MASSSIVFAGPPLAQYALRRADDALLLGHRLSEWCGQAPMLEEELALANIALDLIGQARLLYAYAAEIEAAGHDEDQLAYLRDAQHYGNLLLVEQPNGDFAATMLRQLLYSAYAWPYWQAMERSADATLAAIAAKAAKECAYHHRHAALWVVRLGDGTAESHRRAQQALDDLWMFTGEMFTADALEAPLITAGIAADPALLRPLWQASLDETFAEATLIAPADGWMQQGGRAGRHGEHLGHLLSEMQYLQRAHPGVVW